MRILNVLLLFTILEMCLFQQKIKGEDLGNSDQLPGLEQYNEHRAVIDPLHYPWQIIGRVQTELGGRCTGFLINSRIVVTAAHCLWIEKTKNFIQPSSLHFLLGYSRQNFVVESRISRFIISPAYNPFKNYTETYINAGVDRAFLLLKKPITPKEGFLPIIQQTPVVGTPIWLGGYEQDRKEVLYADRNCFLTGYSRDDSGNFILLHNCQATYGSSGAPLLMRDQQGKWRILGVQVAADIAKAGGMAAMISKFK